MMEAIARFLKGDQVLATPDPGQRAEYDARMTATIKDHDDAVTEREKAAGGTAGGTRGKATSDTSGSTEEKSAPEPPDGAGENAAPDAPDGAREKAPV
jgi:hypothetical protein